MQVVLDRQGVTPLDLAPLIAANSLTWSSVVPGGFASCSFQLEGDPRQLVKQIPYLSILRVIGDSGRVLFEGQVEDLAPTISETSAGLKIGAFGLQNVLKETTARTFWSKRDLAWTEDRTIIGVTDGTQSLVRSPDQWAVQTGAFDATDLSKGGVRIVGVTSGGAAVAGNCNGAILNLPSGLTMQHLMFDYACDNGMEQVVETSPDGTTWANAIVSTAVSGSASQAITSTTRSLRFIGGAVSAFGAVTDAFNCDYFNVRIFGTSAREDASGGFYGGTLIRSLINGYVPELGLGVVEDGSDFTIDHLDASVRRSAYDILQEISANYSREWAVWENALLDWKSPNLSQPQWIIPLAQLSALDLDASVQNSQAQSVVMYTDAATGLSAEQSATSSDRRNPYVLNGRTKDQLNSQSFPMTSLTAQQLATTILNDLGFGPVPAAGSISLPGETVVQHAQGNAAKAWEFRAGDNVTIPELPLADVFTQDGRGECLFHIISAEANASSGTITLSLDSYGSKRSDVLLARLAAVTNALGG